MLQVFANARGRYALGGAQYRKVITTVTAHCCCETRRECTEQQRDEEPIERMCNGFPRLVESGEIALENVVHAGFGVAVANASARGDEIGDIVAIVGRESGEIRDRVGEYGSGFGLIGGVFGAVRCFAAAE